MPMPGFTADTSVYKTNNHYRFGAGASLASDGSVNVVPQGCGWIEGITCGVIIGGGVVVCTASCLASAELGGFPCYACWAAYLGGLYGYCRDCIPSWMKALIDEFESGGGSGGSGGGGGGGGTSHRCCPPGKRCCGTCQKVPGGTMCDDVCVGPHQLCS